jgi:arsenate reductase
MAEGLMRHLGGDRFEAFSAGIEGGRVHPRAVQAMAELGIDISGHQSQPMSDYAGDPMDYIVTTCDEAQEACPAWPGGGQMLHWGFPDPASATGSEEEISAVFRSVRDAIADRIQRFLADVG